MSYGDSFSDTGSGISELFSDYFASNFLASDSASSLSQHVPSFGGQVCDISLVQIKIEQVLNLLRTLDPCKSAGPDSIPASFLIPCAKELSMPITWLFQRSLNEGVVPTVWKSAFVTPIHKSGSRGAVSNYRPISKLCLIAKVLERVVYNQLYNSVKSVFIPEQHGFLRGRSTASNLVLFNDFLTSNMDCGNQVDVVYTDYSKAFDRIDHKILLAKLLDLGIHGKLHNWFTSYLLDRSQSVVLSGYASSWVKIPSGVPQSSLLGPLLFVIFINDINTCFLHSNFLLFADDMKVFRAVNNSQDANLMQEDLQRLDLYCCHNKLDLNASKCFSMSFSRKRKLCRYDYKIKRHILESKTVSKDLGVVHDNRLLFDQHVSQIVNKAFRALGFLIRCSNDFRNMKTIKILYCAYVRSHLEYASQIWNPRYACYSNEIEMIQRKFIRYLGFKFKLFHLADLPYEQRCVKLHILPLYERRHISDITFLLNIAQGKIDCPDLLSKIKLRTPVRNLRKNILLDRPPCHTNFRSNSFLPRVFNAFNKLNVDGCFDVDLFCTSFNSARLCLTKCFIDKQQILDITVGPV